MYKNKEDFIFEKIKEVKLTTEEIESNDFESLIFGFSLFSSFEIYVNYIVENISSVRISSKDEFELYKLCSESINITRNLLLSYLKNKKLSETDKKEIVKRMNRVYDCFLNLVNYNRYALKMPYSMDVLILTKIYNAIHFYLNTFYKNIYFSIGDNENELNSTNTLLTIIEESQQLSKIETEIRTIIEKNSTIVHPEKIIPKETVETLRMCWGRVIEYIDSDLLKQIREF